MPPLARSSRVFDQYISGLIRTFSLVQPSTTSPYATPASQTPSVNPSTSNSNQHQPPPATLIPLYAPELRKASRMGDYTIPQESKKEKRRQQHQQQKDTAMTTTSSNVPSFQVAIPGLTLIQQPHSGFSITTPSQPIPTPSSISAAKKRQSSLPAVPSAASGGVPEPTPQYLTQALLDPYALPQPRRILLIMDLNGTLLYRPNRKKPFNFVERPHAKEFLSYCLSTFYVAIWSSARPENVSKMVDKLLLPAQRDRCLLIWARDRFGLSPEQYNMKVQVYKRLSSIWNHPRIKSSHPTASRGGCWDQTNTVLVDDSLEKARSEPFNLLQIPEFSGLASEQADVLPQVHDYLNMLSYQGDISRYLRIQPFKLDPSYQLPPE
ncbi:HAD-like domain-containing protein [Mariannaea sp. PMI_226]|nr:HAD-like domain-containing protein [Mariannaea sp. PMI_226]